jgi:hypothetical protein
VADVVGHLGGVLAAHAARVDTRRQGGSRVASSAGPRAVAHRTTARPIAPARCNGPTAPSPRSSSNRGRTHRAGHPQVLGSGMAKASRIWLATQAVSDLRSVRRRPCATMCKTYVCRPFRWRVVLRRRLGHRAPFSPIRPGPPACRAPGWAAGARYAPRPGGPAGDRCAQGPAAEAAPWAVSRRLRRGRFRRLAATARLAARSPERRAVGPGATERRPTLASGLPLRAARAEPGRS